jgi:hypothetical protein
MSGQKKSEYRFKASDLDFYESFLSNNRLLSIWTNRNDADANARFFFDKGNVF